VRARGLEPPPLSGPGPKPGASANFATPARACDWRLTVQRQSARAFVLQTGTLVGMHSKSLAIPTGQVAVGDKVGDVYARLLKDRIVFLGSEVDDTSANLLCAQLLLLAAEDPTRDISLYINSPGGSVTAGLAIYDTMQFVPCDISTVCMGLAASMGQFLLCAGTKGKRFSLPHSRILMHQPSGQAQGQAADIAIQAEQIVYLKRMMAERIAFHTGQPVERIEADSDRDRWFTAEEAKEYGFIDQVIARASSVIEPG
jgi:ATP-dependent Clp protease protease subunit